jgi:hypothetical protein
MYAVFIDSRIKMQKQQRCDVRALFSNVASSIKLMGVAFILKLVL